MVRCKVKASSSSLLVYGRAWRQAYILKNKNLLSIERNVDEIKDRPKDNDEWKMLIVEVWDVSSCRCRSRCNFLSFDK